jgi:hypothetical protein
MKSSRRSFLEAGLALPAILNTVPTLTAASQAAKITATKDSSFDPWVEIHRENLRHNVQEIARRVGGRPILAVIKNNGYGMGVANVANTGDAIRDFWICGGEFPRGDVVA